MLPRRPPFLRTARGSVIVIVLITILFAAAALTLFIEKAGNDLLVDAREADANRLRLEAYSALETTLGVLEEFRVVLNGLRSPAEGWGEPLAFAAYEPASGRVVEVQFVDESAKLSLPNVDPSSLVELFKGWDMTQPAAERLSDALLLWMRKDHIPGSASAPRAEDYERGETPSEPAQRSLQSFGELAAIEYARDVFYNEDGEPNELWARFVEAFSLYAFDKPNLNGGNPHVLAAMGVTDKAQIRRVQDFLTGRGTYERMGAGYFKGQDDVAGLLGANSPAAGLSTQISALRIIITVWEGRSFFRLNAVVAPEGGATFPPRGNEETATADPQTGNPQSQPVQPEARTNTNASTKSLN